MNNNQRKRKEQRQNLYVTLTVILMMATVIVAIAVSLAKNPAIIEKPEDDAIALDSGTDDKRHSSPVIIETEYAEDVFFDEDEDADDTEKEKDEDVYAPKDTEDDTDSSLESTERETEKNNTDTESAASPLPEFTAPVKGEILKACSLDVPVFSLTMDDFRTHTGIDIYCNAGCDVASAADGTVTKIWNDPMMGTCISIEHEGGAVSVYKNLCETIPSSIAEGTKVEKGQIIATAGDTSLIELAEESHLHFELSINGKTVDPAEYIEFPSVPTFAE